MKIECAWCRADLGEKCPTCGSTRVIRKTGGSRYFTHFECIDCDEIFFPGDGGNTSTICAKCREQKFTNLPDRLMCDQIVDRAAECAS